MYMKDLVFLVPGGLHHRASVWSAGVCTGASRCGRSTRLGTRPPRLVLGFMVASAFLSFWINNTSTTLLMLPIGVAVIAAVGGGPPRPDDPFAVALLFGHGVLGLDRGDRDAGRHRAEPGTARPALAEPGCEATLLRCQWMLAWVPVVLLVPAGGLAGS